MLVKLEVVNYDSDLGISKNKVVHLSQNVFSESNIFPSSSFFYLFFDLQCEGPDIPSDWTNSQFMKQHICGSCVSVASFSFYKTYISGNMVFPAGSMRRNRKLSDVTSMSAGRTNATARWSTSRWVKRPLM